MATAAIWEGVLLVRARAAVTHARLKLHGSVKAVLCKLVVHRVVVADPIRLLRRR